jgi:hypothetical protein
MEGWAMEEFGGVKLGDERLNRRLLKLATRLADKPTASIPGACGDWAETQAAYRFFEQSSDKKRNLGWEDILAPHITCTEARMRQHPVVLCLQDTTELDFKGQETQGLGPLSYEPQRGMYLHPTYAVTPTREPLGVTDAWMWARQPKDAHGQRPGIIESQRWIEGYERLAETASSMPQTRLVYVADREADILKLMQRAQQLGTPVDWLIRSKNNRALPEGGKLWDTVLGGAPLGQLEFTMAARQGLAARKIRQQVWVESFDLRDSQGGRFPVTCIIAKEIEAPAGCKPVEWRLLSNRTLENFEAAIELIDWYRCRWEIETLFHVLKNGCRVEALQLGHIAKLELALAIYLVVSWRLARLVKLARTQPDLPAKLLFTDAEWKGAYLLDKKTLPKSVPTIREVIRQIAMLGGFLARKGDGEPGVKTLWLGMQRLRDFVAGVEHMQAITNAG